ncbi:hypothetical protein CYMTET_56395 [Cymbomonas tetramitiformis]|uniref:Uncharacterized protein n=1 Tax=Cymbomonas tetramitiformis TaxID=36881 RepID=A0AAE0BBD2_9CHLO|nr:hypothetical protein CYMTET_56395 [Cymbomonas tetramitiformis]
MGSHCISRYFQNNQSSATPVNHRDSIEDPDSPIVLQDSCEDPPEEIEDTPDTNFELERVLDAGTKPSAENLFSQFQFKGDKQEIAPTPEKTALAEPPRRRRCNVMDSDSDEEELFQRPRKVDLSCRSPGSPVADAFAPSRASGRRRLTQKLRDDELSPGPASGGRPEVCIDVTDSPSGTGEPIESGGTLGDSDDEVVELHAGQPRPQEDDETRERRRKMELLAQSAPEEDDLELTNPALARKLRAAKRRRLSGGAALSAVDSLLFECEAISRSLRDSLGLIPSGEAGCSEVQATKSSMRLQSAELIRSQCGLGDAGPLLKEYQVVGVNYLALLHKQGVGGILADEMGLGKTAQAISFLGMLQAREGAKRLPHLVVVPASLLANWQRELGVWCPGLRVVLFHGADRAQLVEELRPFRPGAEKAYLGAPFDVMLTCYSLFERDSQQQREDRQFLKSWEWSHLILDEAHLLKNADSTRSMKLASVATRCSYRLMLTGTPLQNDMLELFNLLQFQMPDLFSVDMLELDGQEDEQALISKVKGILAPLVLRRLKSQVLSQLPAKSQQMECLEMTPGQRKCYLGNLQRAKSQYSAESAGARPSRAVLSAAKMQNLFVMLRKTAHHPMLGRNHYSDEDLEALVKTTHKRGFFGPDAKESRIAEELGTYSDFKLHQVCEQLGRGFKSKCLSRKHIMDSAKFAFLQELLPALKERSSRPLIFSQWTSMLDLLEWFLDELGLSYCRLDGSTAVDERQQLVDAYNAEDSNIFAFLLTTRAGGQGLNLKAADTVIIHDVDFNPQVDKQAEDRAHRIGQTRKVTIYRLITKDSVDEKILEIANRKLRLDASLMDTGAAEAATSKSGAAESNSIREILASILIADTAETGSAEGK